MNKTIKYMMIAGLACVAFCGTTIAAPRGGHGGKAPQRTAPARPVQTRPAQTRPAPPRQPAGRAVHRSAPHGPGLGHHPAPPRPAHGFGHHPRPMRHWYRPVMPPIRPRALHAWTWIATPWTIFVDGVYCTGDGYWFDGYNYYYNDCYYTTAPVSVTISF